MRSSALHPGHLLAHLRHAARLRSAFHCRQLHAHLHKTGLAQSPPFPNALIDLYGKCCLLRDAHLLFDETPNRDPVLWSSFLSAHARSKCPRQVFSLIPTMIHTDGVLPDDFMFATFLKASGELKMPLLGRQVHAQVVSSGFHNDDVVKSALVDMYGKCHVPDVARKVFDSVAQRNSVCWTAMVSGYASNGWCSDAIVIFQMMPEKQLKSWTALISGFVQSGENVSAVRLFLQMQREGVVMDDCFVLSSVVGAAANLAALELGRQFHGLSMVLGYELNLLLGNALVDMYAKCSDIHAARTIFESISIKDIVSWTTMIIAEARHGRAEEALALYERMIPLGMKPNEVTFVGLLYACSHMGLIQRGRYLFDSMISDYRIRPSLQHYTCMVDLLSRSQLLSEAEDFIKVMPITPDEAMWAALLNCCRRYGDMERSVRIADHLLTLQPKDPSTYILLSNTYATGGKWDRVVKMRKLIEGMDTRKEAGYSWVEAGKESHMFRAGEVSFQMRDEILRLIEELMVEMKRRGYVPDTSSVLHDMEEQEKEQQLSLHSERLAVAFGLLRAAPGVVIRVIKNLRVCVDCHVVLKLISSISGREIVVRDANRFHHFKDGACSCGDFW